MNFTKIKKVFAASLVLLMICSFAGGCEFKSQYIDPETGEINATVAPISLLKKSSIKALVNTDTNVFFLMNDVTGSVLATGSNAYGLLGQGTASDEVSSHAVRVKLPERIKYIDANYHIGVAVSETEKVYIWGDLSPWGDDAGNDGDIIYKSFQFDSIVSGVSVGKEHIAVITKEGSVYTMGINRGQLGYDFDTNLGVFYSEFKKIESDEVFHDVETSDTATYMRTGSGELYGCSANENYELGYVGTLRGINKLDTVKPIKKITTAGKNLFALADDGTVFACGENTNGVLGLGNKLPYAASLIQLPFDGVVADISANDDTPFVHFLTDEGKLYACGTNDSLGVRSQEDSIYYPMQVQVTSSVIREFYGYGSTRFYIDEGGRLYTYGCNTHGQMPDVKNTGEYITSPVRLYLNIK